MNGEIQGRLSRGIDPMGTERCEDAVEPCKGALTADGSNYGVRLNLGNAYMSLGKPEGGIVEFKESLLAGTESGEALAMEEISPRWRPLRRAALLLPLLEGLLSGAR